MVRFVMSDPNVGEAEGMDERQNVVLLDPAMQIVHAAAK